MSYPQNPYPQPPAPQYPQQGYPQPPAPQYPPQQQQAWAAPQYPQQGYPQQPQAPAAPPVNATMDDFYGQPSSGHGPAWSFKDRPAGTTYAGIVARTVTNSDIQQQTQPGTGAPATYRDGRPKLVLKVPMNVQPDQTFPEGRAQWYVQGGARDELARAMAEAGAPSGPPEAGAVISVTLTGRRPVPGMNPANVVSVRYQRPAGAPPVNPQDHAQAQNGGAPQQPEQQVPVAQPTPANMPPQAQPHSTQVWQAVAPQQPVTGQQPAPAPQQPAQPAPQAPSDLSAEQAALLAQLTNSS